MSEYFVSEAMRLIQMSLDAGDVQFKLRVNCTWVWMSGLQFRLHLQRIVNVID